MGSPCGRGGPVDAGLGLKALRLCFLEREQHGRWRVGGGRRATGHETFGVQRKGLRTAEVQKSLGECTLVI